MPGTYDPALTFPRSYLRALQDSPGIVQERMAWVDEQIRKHGWPLSDLDTRNIATRLRTLLPMLEEERRVVQGTQDEPPAAPRRAFLLVQLHETLAILEAVLKAHQG